MFGKIFKKNHPTDNIGISDAKVSNSGSTEKATYITFPQLPKEPSIRLEKKITIGTEVGELILPKAEISARHCSFFFNQGIISLMDHSSTQGTFINKKRLDPGKIFILNTKDKIRLGNYDVKVELLDIPVTTEDVSEEHFEDKTASFTQIKIPNDDEFAPPNFEELDISLAADEELPSSEIDLTDVDVEEELLDANILSPEVQQEHEQITEQREQLKVAQSEKTATGIKIGNEDLLLETSPGGLSGVPGSEIIQKGKGSPLKASGSKKGKRKKSKVKVKVTRGASSSFLTRFFGYLNDVVLCFIIIEVFSIFEDFATFYRSLPTDIWKILSPHFNKYIVPLYDQYLGSISLVTEVLSDIKDYEKLSEVFSFMCLVFVFRVMTGIIFSATLGQLIIGMRIQGKFLWKRIIFPVRELIGMLLFPFIIFDLPAIISKRTFKEMITFTQYLTPRPKLTFVLVLIMTPSLLIGFCIAPLYRGLETMKAVTVKEVNKVPAAMQWTAPVYVESLNLTYNQDENIRVLPSFNFTVKNKKDILNTGLVFVDVATGSIINIRKVKNFSLIEIYTSFVDKNYLAEYFQPEIHALVRNVARQNEDFNFKISKPDLLAKESQALIKNTYELELEKFLDFMLVNGVFMTGFRDFREKLDNVFSESVQTLKLGNIGRKQGVLAQLNTGRNQYFEFAPLEGQKGELYFISDDIFSKKHISIAKIFAFGKLDKKNVDFKQDDVVEYIENIVSKKIAATDSIKQSLYERYFYVAKELLKNDQFPALKEMDPNINQFLSYLQKSENKNRKLIQNLTQLLQAIRDQDYKFFNLQLPNTESV